MTDMLHAPLSLEEKRALLASLLPAHQAPQTAAASFAQQRLWLLDRLQPGNPAYAVPLAFRLRGALDVDALRRALGEVVRRHEALRTTFAERDGTPVQVIHPPFPLELPVDGLHGVPAGRREAEALERAAAEAARPFDLAAGPLFRARLLRLDGEDHVLVMSMHHVVADGWSLGVLFQEISALYGAFAAGAQSPLGEPPLQYADYAEWQRERMETGALDGALDWWRGELAGAPALLELPADRARPAAQSGAGARARLRMDAPLAEALRGLARAEGATLHMVLLAGFQALLARFCGQEQVVVGTPVAGRTRTELEGLIGFFVNTLALRADLSGAPGFRALLAQVRRRTVGAYQHQELPFDRLVEALGVERTLAHGPLVQALLVLQNADAGALRLGDAAAERLELPVRAAKFDLSLELAEDAAGIDASLVYSTDLFDAPTAARLLDAYRTLLAAVAADPDAAVADAPLLADAERHQLLHGWNERLPALPADRCVHQLVEAQAARTPDAVAVVHEGRSITLGALNARANRLAHRLRRLGVGPEERVAVCLERGIDLVVSLLAVLKSGGAYVPLDPAYPADRLDAMLRDSGARVVLTRESLRAKLAEAPAGAYLLRLEDPAEAEEIARESAENPRSGVRPQNLSHLIYTSGSTGRPKGVMLRHAGTCVMLQWAAETFPADEHRAVLAATSICFDISVFEIFWPLTVGLPVVMVDDALALARLGEDAGITLLNTVPSAAAELVRMGGIPRTVHTVNLAGEPLPRALSDAVYGLGHVRVVTNLYGPSEDTTYTTWNAVRAGEDPTLGTALHNTRLYVLDGRMNPVPVGVAGELYLAGDGLGRGYLGQPARTAERWVPLALGAPGERAYRTGDRVRWRADGELEYLGRVDFQVKVRGFRVEPGEIEAVLRGHPAVREAVVLARGEGADRRLVAWVVREQGAAADPRALRDHVAGRLPAFMVPAAVTVLDAFPLNPNGKLDRARLPEPEFAGALAEHVAPRTPLESLLAEIWLDLLPAERVGVDDDFFALGGHSLVATRLVSRIREALGVELPLRAVFEASTLGALAERVDAARRDGSLAPLPALQPAPREDGRAPASFAQRRLWVLERLEPGSAAYVLPASVRLAGALDADALARAITEVVRRHEALRTVFAEHDGEPFQVVRPAAEVPLPVVDLSNLADDARADAVRAAAAEDARTGFDLERGPLFRARLLRLAADEHVLLLAMHHAVSDGWSLGVLYREISALYGAFAEGRTSPLAELPLQYADHAAWERAHLSGDALEERLAFWRRQLQGAPALLDLPTDRPRPAVREHRGEVHRTILPAALLGRLRALGRAEGATLYMVLLAGYQALLSRLSGQSDVVVGSPAAGRTRAEAEGLIGFFVNTLPLRADLGEAPDFRALLRQARERTLAAHEHQEVPFETLVTGLGIERTAAHNPLFQALFNLHNFPGGSIDAAGVTSTLLRPELDFAAKFDLTLYAREEEDGLHLALLYDAALFDRARAVEMVAQYAALLEQAAAEPSRPVAAYSLVTPAAAALLPAPAQPIAADWHGPAHARLAAHAAAHPDRVAVEDDAVSITYLQVEERSNRLAHWLGARGIGAGDVVAVHAHRGAALPVAMLGIAKAGAAFTLLDPAQPASRSAARLRVAKPAAWLALEGAGEVPAELVEAAADVRARLVISVDGSAADLADHPATAPSVDVGPETLAYVAFTSGTTGEPKAILGTHRPLSHFLEWHAREHGLGADDRFSMLSGLMHDPLLRDVFAPLRAGATLVVPAAETLTDAPALRGWMAARGVTVAHLTPALARLLTGEGGGPALPKLRFAFFGGDALTYGDAARLRAVAPSVSCVNFYGATETPQAIAFHRVGTAAAPAGAKVPVGRGVPGSQLLVCTAAGALAGIGEPGEVCVRSPYLSPGYAGDAGREGAFVINPFTNDPADRVYRTGDLGRYRPDGSVQLAGRADRQVKVRGFRVEPAEVEAALRRHPAVRDAVAAPRAGADGETRLVAWIVPADGAALPEGLRAFLRESLPDYMLPSAFAAVEAVPLTRSGKVDLAALPEPEAAAGAGERRAPRTPEEEVLAAVWSELLGVREIGIDDDFFALGGHSLTATRLISRVQEAFRVTLPLRLLFDAPTVAGMAAALRERRGARAESGVTAGVSAPDAAYEPFPLTDVQQAYWVGRQGDYELGNVATFGYFELETAELDAERYTAAWRRLIDRHDMLRAVVLPTGEQQVLASVPALEPAFADLSALDADAAEAELLRLRAGLSHQVRDPAQWPLFHVGVSKLPGGRWRLHFGFDALTLDAWSRRMLLRELGDLYARPETELEPLGFTFRDYVLAENGLHGTPRHAEDEAYWDARLDTLPGAPELPLACAPGSVREPRFTRRHAGLDAERWTALKARAARAGLTPSGVLLSAYARVLGAWSKAPRFTINLTVFNRVPFHADVQRIAGDFTSTSLMEVECRPAESFEDAARRLQSRLWEDLDHPLVSGVQVVRKLARRRGDLSGAMMPVVFTSTLGFQGPSDGARSPLGTGVFAISQTPQVWLDHQVGERDGALLFNWDAVEELFPAGMLDDAFDGYTRLLQALADDDAAWSGFHPPLLPAWQRATLARVNDTAAPVPDGLLHERFAEQARRTPAAAAVIAPGRTLDYAEIDRRSARLGGALRERGAKPNQLVAIVMEKGWEQVVASLGILRSGAAYVPVDPGLPTERIHHLLRHAEVALVVTQPWLEASLEWPDSVQRFVIDTEEDAAEPVPVLRSVQGAEDLAYIIYTSGSTGLPKGVMIDHRGALNTIVDLNRRYAVGADDRVLALSSLSFDLSVYDIFGLLAAGGAIVLPEADRARDPARWAELVLAERVTLWNTVPQLMEMLINHCEGRPELYPAPLRLVMMSGDWVPVSLPDRIRVQAPAADVWSLGGATEASIWSILYPIRRVDPAWKSIPYGTAMVNQSFHVLDDALEPRPVWVPGNLYIGGIGLALGYWRDAEKTAGSFVRHPRTGERLYRTGDLGRVLPDGNIEFLGREDFQVKIQGHRIELGEIEAALSRHPSVHEAVVAARDDGPGGKRLVGYVIPRDGQTADEEALRAHLAARLPRYMVPTAIVSLPAFPLSSNGKVDRKQLPAPAASEAGTPRQAPRTGTETELAELWSTLLGVENVGADDGFFELGGNSVVATRLIGRVRARYGIELPLRALFDDPTLAGLAARVDQAVAERPAAANEAKGGDAEASAQAEIPRLARRRPVPARPAAHS
jgi:amino acid adenylation domain-containing protein